MQLIAAVVNYSETVFVLPPEDPRHAARLRIFTPRAELPFAGHPTVGAALMLARLGRLPATAILEEAAGPIQIGVEWRDGAPVRAEFTAPQRVRHGARIDAVPVAAALGLAETDLALSEALPCAASCGTEFLLVELASLAALARATLGAADGKALHEHGVFLFTRDTGEHRVDLRARMFAPQHGIGEDPATGSAAAALAGLLAALDPASSGLFHWNIAQGVEMGRASLIEATAEKHAGAVRAVRIAGAAVPVMEGWIEI
jgi:trans-2,3-dihydro-3-hydroxyanthranilate isomerase